MEKNKDKELIYINQVKYIKDHLLMIYKKEMDLYYYSIYNI